MTKVFTIARMPQELAQAWLQHLRDFDTAHPGCHFEVAAEPAPSLTLEQMIAVLRVDPALTFTTLLERKKGQEMVLVQKVAPKPLLAELAQCHHTKLDAQTTWNRLIALAGLER